MRRRALLLWVWLVGVVAAFGGPGEGIRIGNLTVSPFVDASITYDSNVFLTETNRVEDFYIQLVPGIAFLNRTERVILSGRAWLQLRDYLEVNEKDNEALSAVNSEGVGEKLGLIIGDEEYPAVFISQKFVRLNDYELYPRSVDVLDVEGNSLMLTEDRSERVERDLFDFGGAVGRWLTDKLRVYVGYAYVYVDYDTDLLNDWDEQRAQVAFLRKVTERTSILLTGQYGLQDSDGYDDETRDSFVRIGVFKKTSAKTTVKGTFGFESFKADFLSEAGDSLDKDIFSYDVSGAWHATTRLILQLSGRNGIQPATQYDNNAKVLSLIQLGASYRLTETIRLSLAGSYREDDYIGRVIVDGEPQDKERRLLGGRLRMDYRPHLKFYDLYAEVSYEEVEDNLKDDYEDYDQLRAGLGIFLRY